MRALLLIGLLFAACAHAQLSGTVNVREVRPNEAFTLTITGTGQTVGRPVLPETSDFTFLNPTNPSVGHQTSMSLVQGQLTSSSSVSYTYQVKVNREGTFTLPGIRLTVDGKEYATEPLDITCSQNVVRRPARRQPRSILDMLNPPMPIAPETVKTEDIPYFDVSTDKAELYVGEPLTVTLKFGELDEGGVQAQFHQIPQLKTLQGFYTGDAGTQLGQTREKIGGRVYRVAGEKQTWYPTVAGDFTLPPLEVTLNVLRGTRNGTDERVVTRKSLPIAIRVKPLPPAPPAFSGAIGELSVATSVAAHELLQGSGVELLVTVTGQGNPATVSAPTLPELPWAHLSAPDEAGDPLPLGTIKLFRYTLTPLEVGNFEFPAVSINYFSPTRGEYTVTTANAIKLIVKKAMQGAPVVVTGANNPALAGRGLATIHPILRTGANLGPSGGGWALNSAFAVLPPALYAAGFLYARWRRRLAEDSSFAREYFARSKSQKRLAGVLTANDPADALYHALAGFVADKLGVEEAGMTSADARQALARRGLPAELATGVEKILRACERARYAGAQPSEAELRALLDAAVQAMDKLEDALKPGGAE